MKEKAKKVLQSKYFVGSIIVTLIYIIYLIIAKVSPFGNNSILKTDLYQQYAEFLNYFRECLLGEKSILFSWNLGLGNNFFTTYAYYLASPFNLLLIFFNANNIYVFVEIVTYLKILMIFNMSLLFLQKGLKFDKKIAILFALAYTYSSYTICYMLHIMWLDAMYMLPIILITIEKYLENNKIYPVIITIGLNILFNYYLGFITAIFSTCYYIARLIIKTKGNKDEIKLSIKAFAKFIIGLCISAGISMVLFLPSFMQAKSTMETGKTALLKINKEKIYLLFNIVFNNHNYLFEQKAGIVFSSTFVTIMCIMFFLNKNIKKKEKIMYFVGLVFMLLPIFSPLLNKMWHGMTNPNCFYYRYSFCLIFLTMIMGARCYQEKEGITKKHFVVNFIIYILITLIELILNITGRLQYSGSEKNVTNLSIIISALTYLVMLGVLYLKLYGNKKTVIKTAEAILVIALIFDIGISINSYQTTNNDNYFTIQNVKQYDSIMEKVLDKIDCKETDRIVFKPNDVYTVNYSLKYGYSSIDYFTSARNKETIRGMYQLGYNIQRDDALWLTSESGTSINYLMAGVKYIVTKDSLDGTNKLFLYDFVENIEGYNIYKLNIDFDFGYYLKENINQNQNDNPFFVAEIGPLEYQNKILQNMTNTETNYLYSLDNISNSNENKTNSNNVNKDNNDKNTNINESEDYKKLNVTKTITCDDKEYIITYNLKPEIETDIYIYSDNNLQLYKRKTSDYLTEENSTINKQQSEKNSKNTENYEAVFDDYANIWSKEAGIKEVVHLEKNEEYQFYITVKKKVYEKESERIEVYALDNEKIKNALENIDIIETTNITVKQNYIELEIEATEDGIVALPIAFDEGLRAIVNGNKENVIKVNQCFSGVNIKKGTTKIKIYFVPRYLKIGVSMTIISLICLIIVIIVENRKKKIYNKGNKLLSTKNDN